MSSVPFLCARLLTPFNNICSFILGGLGSVNCVRKC